MTVMNSFGAQRMCYYNRSTQYFYMLVNYDICACWFCHSFPKFQNGDYLNPLTDEFFFFFSDIQLKLTSKQNIIHIKTKTLKVTK